jgi:hypothetical protein
MLNYEPPKKKLHNVLMKQGRDPPMHVEIQKLLRQKQKWRGFVESC